MAGVGEGQACVGMRRPYALAPDAVSLNVDVLSRTEELPVSVRVRASYVAKGTLCVVDLGMMRCGAEVTAAGLATLGQNAVGPVRQELMIRMPIFQLTAEGELQLTVAGEMGLRQVQDACLDVLATALEATDVGLVLVPSALEDVLGAYPQGMVNVVAIELRRQLVVEDRVGRPAKLGKMQA